MMTFDIPENATLAEAFNLFRNTYGPGEFLKPEEVAFIIRLLENPDYSLKIFGKELFPGRVSLTRHDYLHTVCGMRGVPSGEAFVIGATMGSTKQMTAWRTSLFIWIENMLAPDQYDYDFQARKLFHWVVKESTTLAQAGILKDLSLFDIENHTTETVFQLRKHLGLDILLERLHQTSFLK